MKHFDFISKNLVWWFNGYKFFYETYIPRTSFIRFVKNKQIESKFEPLGQIFKYNIYVKGFETVCIVVNGNFSKKFK